MKKTEQTNTILFIKSIVYRVVRLLLLLVVSLLVLGDIKTALSISFIDALIATAYYFYFDKYWERYFEPFVKKILISIKYHSFDT